MKHKMVNLCPTSFELAAKKKNFSKWVREELLKDHSKEDKRYRYQCEDCGLISIAGMKHGRVRSCIPNECCMGLSDVIGVVEDE